MKIIVYREDYGLEADNKDSDLQSVLNAQNLLEKDILPSLINGITIVLALDNAFIKRTNNGQKINSVFLDYLANELLNHVDGFDKHLDDMRTIPHSDENISKYFYSRVEKYITDNPAKRLCYLLTKNIK